MNSPIPASEQQINVACEQALRLAPKEFLPTLPGAKQLFEVPLWHSFENEAWPIGESIRLAFVKNPRFRKNDAVLAKVIEVATCRNLRRGRQSFILALGFVAAQKYAKTLIPSLSDPDVDGQVIDTLIKMKAPGFAHEVAPLLHSKRTWIRRLAEKYIDRYPPEW